MLSTTWTLSRMVYQNWRSIRLLIKILGTSLNFTYSERIFLVLTLPPSSSLVIILVQSYSSSAVVILVALGLLIVARRRRRFCDLRHRASLCDPVKHHISNWIFHCTYINFIIQERYCIWCTRRQWQGGSCSAAPCFEHIRSVSIILCDFSILSVTPFNIFVSTKWTMCNTITTLHHIQ